VMLRSPGLMSPLQKVGEYLRFKCEVDRKLAELTTLMPRGNGPRTTNGARITRSRSRPD
jgi:hypothetical protein